MAKHNKKGRSTGKLAPFAAIERYVIDSAAYRNLSLPARAALIEFLYAYNGSNNGSIIMSARMLGARLNCSHGSAAIYIRQLEDVGFIEATHMGGFARRNRRASEFLLTMYPCDNSGRRASKRFMGWMPPSNRLDAQVKPVRQSQQNCSRRSNQNDRKRQSSTSGGLSTNTHLDVTIGCGHEDNVSLLAQAADQNPWPEMPSFLVRAR